MIKLTDGEFMDYMYERGYSYWDMVGKRDTKAFKEEKRKVEKKIQQEINEKNRKIDEYHKERDRSARTCTSCGAKHWNNATLCTTCCDREVFGR